MRKTTLWVVALVGLLWAPAAWAGTHTNLNWSTLPDGGGQKCDLNRANACYYDSVNQGDSTTSPVLAGAAMCSQVFTRWVENSGTCQIDIQACNASGTASCTDLTNGSNLTASSLGPEGGVAAGIRVNNDTATTCDYHVEVVCGREH